MNAWIECAVQRSLMAGDLGGQVGSWATLILLLDLRRARQACPWRSVHAVREGRAGAGGWVGVRVETPHRGRSHCTSTASAVLPSIPQPLSFYPTPAVRPCSLCPSPCPCPPLHQSSTHPLTLPTPAGLIRKDWAKQFPHDSVVVESVASIVVRKGNPLNIRGWDDLTRWVGGQVGWVCGGASSINMPFQGVRVQSGWHWCIVQHEVGPGPSAAALSGVLGLQ